MNPYLFITPLIAGYVLDMFLGDPRWLPHPIRLFGRIINYCDKTLNQGKRKQLKGLLVAVLLPSITFAGTYGLLWLIKPSATVHFIVTTVFVYYGIANKCLITEVLKVEKTLQRDDIDKAREQLSYLVGRETKNLDTNQVRIALLETLSENLSDGVIAPLFFYAIGGAPLMLAYKMVNTLDSMIGYKNEKYLVFGKASARLDDIVNFVPSRLTALIMVIITLSIRGGRYIVKYGHKHTSPNAGYPEAALAGILNCRFGGPNVYHNKLVNKPYIGKNYRTISKSDINKGLLVNFSTSLVFVVIISLIKLFYYILG